jgi:hypothetical protein
MKLGRAALLVTMPLMGLLPIEASAQGPAQMPCGNEIIPLRQAVERDAQAVKAAVDRKADRAVVCNGIKRFAASEAKFVNYLEANQSWCSIPPAAIKQDKATHAHTFKIRTHP